MQIIVISLVPIKLRENNVRSIANNFEIYISLKFEFMPYLTLNNKFLLLNVFITTFHITPM